MDVVTLLEFEEGYEAKPYLCSLGYPTVGIGCKIGPKGADLSLYQFCLPHDAAKQWAKHLVNQKMQAMAKCPEIAAALAACNDARRAILISMAYQMGVNGLNDFKNTLKAIADQDWSLACREMLDSLWAKQTPSRAARHSQQMLTGEWPAQYTNRR